MNNIDKLIKEAELIANNATIVITQLARLRSIADSLYATIEQLEYDQTVFVEFLYEEKCWDMITAIGWATKSIDSFQMQIDIEDKYSPEEISRLYLFIIQKQTELIKKLNWYDLDSAQHKGTNINMWQLNDENLEVLVTHIIGLGRIQFNDIMENPIKATGMSYVENFLYCFSNYNKE